MKGSVVAAAVLSCVAHTPSAAAPHAHTARQHGAATDDAWSPIGAYTNSLNPTGVPTGIGKPDGGGWGYGCTSICQGEFDNIEDLFDDFVATSYKTLQTSFETVGSEVENIVSDAAALVLAKVQAKATAVSHQHARLDATYKVLVDLIGDPDSPEAQALVADHQRTLNLEGSGDEDAASSLAAFSLEKDVHRLEGVAWSTFAVQVGVALCMGCVVESWRIRSRAAAGLK